MKDILAERQMQTVFDVVKEIRKFRSVNRIPKTVQLTVTVLGNLSSDQRRYIAHMGNCEVAL